MKKFLVFVLVLTLSISILIGSAEDAYAMAIRNNPGFAVNTLAPNDDGSTAAVNIGFVIDFYNFVTGQLFVNNNGNITFDSPLAAFTPPDLTSTTKKIIAPFFADVDTRFAGNPVTYGQDLVNGRPAFGASWIMVDCISNVPLGLNDFQVVLIERFDTGAGNFDIELNYDTINWETGDFPINGVVNCLGGNSARVGFSDGSGLPGTFFEFVGSAIPGAFIDGGPNSLAQNSLNSNVPGRYIIPVRGGIADPNPQPMPVIGGEILSIESTALLVSGIQSSFIWLLPAIVGVASVTLYLKKIKN